MVERKHQHILQVARAIGFIQSSFYIFGVSVCYLLFTSLIGFLFHYCTTKDLMKSCLNTFPLIFILEPLVPCFVSTLPLNRSKFDPRAKPCVFIGYPAGIKGYKVLDLASKTIFVSRDVHFLEHIFPFPTSSKPLSPNHSTISDVLDPTSEFCRFSAVSTYRYSSRTCSSTSSFSHC